MISTLFPAAVLLACFATGAAAQGSVDPLRYATDARYFGTPFGTVVLPPAGSWMVGPVDLTPTKHTVFTWAAALLTVGVLVPVSRLRARAAAGRGGSRVAAGALEMLAVALRDRVVVPAIGPGGERYVPFVLTLFFFILFANLLGLVPFGVAATANFSVTAALALTVFVVCELAGLRRNGVRGYLGTIFHRPAGMGPVGGWAMAVALAPLELLGRVMRPFALALRLMANMLAGKILIYTVLGMVAAAGSYLLAPAPLLMAVAMTLLKVFVAVLQAYVFALLTSVFIGRVTRAH
ncbi:MAG: F0F1 ATP synthase subunit A [Gemmatimonadota bacterium]